MKRPICLLALLIALATSGSAFGANYWTSLFGGNCTMPFCIKAFGCDHYRSKSLPCPNPVTCFGPDCYIRKALPCPSPVKHFGCDTYHRKSLPASTCPNC